jgi:hypothetical protein
MHSETCAVYYLTITLISIHMLFIEMELNLHLQTINFEDNSLLIYTTTNETTRNKN